MGTDLPHTMRAVLLVAHGGPECLEVRTDHPVPRPGAGEVLIRVSAAAVNNTDVNTRVGWYSGGGWTGSFTFPRIQGIDACGTVVAVGSGVPAGRIGERVLVEPCWRDEGAHQSSARFFGSEVDGAFADYTVAPSRHAHRVQSTLDDVELASFPCSWSTAENMLTRAGVRRGQRVLVTGASGGVGGAAMQLAHGRGADVVVVAAADKHEPLLSLAAQEAVDRDDDLVECFGTDSFDVVIDVVGGSQWPQLLQVLRPGGHYATAGAIAGPLVELDLRTLYLKDITMHGCTVLDDGVFAALVRRVEHGELRPQVAATYPLERIAEAQAEFVAKRHVGKIVLDLRLPAR